MTAQRIEPTQPAVPHPHPRSGADPTIYVFMDAEGTEVRAKRRDFGKRYGINPGSMTDLLRRKVQTAHGWCYIGPADDQSTG